MTSSTFRKMGLAAGFAGAMFAGIAAAGAQELMLYDLESLSGPGQTMCRASQLGQACRGRDQQSRRTSRLATNPTRSSLTCTTTGPRQRRASLPSRRCCSSANRSSMVGSLSSGVTGAYAPIIRDRDDVISVVLGAALFFTAEDKAIYHPRVAVARVHRIDGLVPQVAARTSIVRGILTDNKHGRLRRADADPEGWFDQGRHRSGRPGRVLDLARPSSGRRSLRSSAATGCHQYPGLWR